MRSLPETLDETYDRILQKLDKEYVDDALMVLRWLAFSFRPMALNEAAEVIAVDTTQGIVDLESRLPEPRDIVAICSSLVTVSLSRDKDGESIGECSPDAWHMGLHISQRCCNWRIFR